MSVNIANDHLGNGVISNITFNRSIAKLKAINVNSVEKISHVDIRWSYIDVFIREKGKEKTKISQLN